MKTILMAALVSVVVLPVLLALIRTRNDPGMLRRLKKSEGRAMARYLWFM
ncbi:MAG: hypothetical protein V3S64_05480 [bacterium]